MNALQLSQGSRLVSNKGLHLSHNDLKLSIGLERVSHGCGNRSHGCDAYMVHLKLRDLKSRDKHFTTNMAAGKKCKNNF